MSNLKRAKAAPVGLGAAEFFARRLPGYSMSDAHLSTRISYSTIQRIVHAPADSHTPTAETAKKLEEWSRGATAEYDVFISSALVLGLQVAVQLTGTDR